MALENCKECGKATQGLCNGICEVCWYSWVDEAGQALKDYSELAMYAEAAQAASMAQGFRKHAIQARVKGEQEVNA